MTAGSTTVRAEEGTGLTGHRLLFFTLSLGAFAIGTDSMIISGLLGRIATGLHVSASAAGQLVTVFAVVYAVAAPILAALTAQMERKTLLLSALGVFIVANLLGAAAPSYPTLMAARVLAALGAGLYLPNAMAVTVSISPKEQRGRAIAIIAGGMSAAAALGVPAGTLIGALDSWRLTLLAVAVLSIVAAVALLTGLPRVAPSAALTLSERLKAGAHPQVLIALLTNALMCAGEFTLFIYVAPLASGLVGGGAVGLTGYLLLWGVTALVGSFLGGRAADAFGGRRSYAGAASGVLLGVVAVAVLSVLRPAHGAGAAVVLGVLIVVIGVSSGVLPTAQNHRISGIEGANSTVALSLNGSSSYLGLAVAGAAGGAALAAGSLDALCWTAVGFTTLALLVLGLAAPRKATPAS
ncbi:MAG TPA: MFS transporter [Actinocrinis sp.]|nr:MFS transporter [Actinocrinis sp.]